MDSSESTWVISGCFLCTYIIIHAHTRTGMYVRAYTHVAGWHTSEGDFTSLLSVVVDGDGSRLEHRGDKDLPWHLGGC